MNVLVIGSGLAGLSAARHLARSSKKAEILVLEKSEESCSSKAQGGIACALDESDSLSLHERDTIQAGAGLCDEEAVKLLVREGKERISELIDLGAPFDREKRAAGALFGKEKLYGAASSASENTRLLSFGLEAAHSRKRILHSHGDETGKHVTRFMRNLAREENVCFEKGFLVDFAVEGKECVGAFVERKCAIDFISFDACILASGGYASIFSKSSNPASSTGDGVAAAFRAGAVLADLEFVQFHPTVIAGSGQLVSESVRGEGAVLVNDRGERFAEKLPGKELATRDVLTRAIFEQLNSGRKVFLDATRVQGFEARFPSITRECRKRGIRLPQDFIPVEPAAHYCMGGVKTSLDCSTSLRRLFACGEAACTGVHGANRLASNSLLEALVFGFKAAETALKLSINSKQAKPFTPPAFSSAPAFPPTTLNEVQRVLWGNAGVVRCKKELLEAKNFFKRATKSKKEKNTHGNLEFSDARSNAPFLRTKNAGVREHLELLNACTIGSVLVEACLARRESRGSHFRRDFPSPESKFRKHFNFSIR
ncbi:L-aspartate oxidase [Candidatus Micrarchaeota archaeon]|nr:L-aspartate oxidase [Candidatus Micrarchaeota archaeon]